jgi:hypothetical protein
LFSSRLNHWTKGFNSNAIVDAALANQEVIFFESLEGLEARVDVEGASGFSYLQAYCVAEPKKPSVEPELRASQPDRKSANCRRTLTLARHTTELILSSFFTF